MLTFNVDFVFCTWNSGWSVQRGTMAFLDTSTAIQLLCQAVQESQEKEVRYKKKYLVLQNLTKFAVYV